MPPQGETNGTTQEIQIFPWSEVEKHNTEETTWIVVKGEVYDVTNWKNKHPGGKNVLMDSSGQDVSIPFKLYHDNQDLVQKYMKSYKIGKVAETTITDVARERWERLDEEYERLTKMAQDLGYYQADYFFWSMKAYFIWSMVGWSMAIFPMFGFNWFTFILSTVLMAVGQTIGAYQQHNLGHKAVTHTFLDRIYQRIQMNVLLGFAGCFWLEYHSRHHIKPNMLDKDPTITINEHIFVIGTKRAEERAERDKTKGYTTTRFNLQHFYWPLVGIPLYIPVLFQIASFRFAWKQKSYLDFALMAVFFAWYFPIFSHLLGWQYTLLHFWIARNLMSQFFTWFSLASHLQLDQFYEPPTGFSWFEIQLENTVNLGTSYFSDFITGYQNWQIEHHLWPTMPMENLRKMAPHAKEVCKKYNIRYRQHGSIHCYANVTRMMRKCGLRWFEVVQHTLSGD